ncbi:MauE/DoxX family redox-associated membrane protein [Herbiconiux sp. A18JL235]|uniref:MauE/DoxX family redox-associated membrane protein n=1 Tax=Herbiconiux sp. A18JL235 TaxID=3152363 RepID=A0AB39BIC6_9MICO
MTTAVGTALALTLAVVFGWSGVAKLSTPGSTRRSLEEFGVPGRAAGWGAWALPLGECTIAIVLIVVPGPAFIVAGAASIALLVVFSVALARVVRAGEAVHCNCFGVASTAPVSWRSVVRNLALVVVAGGAVLLGGDAVAPTVAGFAPAQWTAFFATTTLVLAVVAVVAVATRARAGRASTAGEAQQGVLEQGPGRDGAEWPVPDLEVTDRGGRAVELATIASARPTLLVLLSADCTPCTTVAARLDGWADAVGASVGVAVLTSAEPRTFAERYPHLGAPVYYGSRSLMAAAQIAGLPAALLLTPARTVAAGPAQGSDEVAELLSAIGHVIGVNTDVLPVSHHEIAT